MRSKRRFLLVLVVWVALLFAAGVTWRAFHPGKSENPDEEEQIASRQDGYYLCLHRPTMSVGEMYKLIARRLPHDDPVLALRGCREAQRR